MPVNKMYEHFGVEKTKPNNTNLKCMKCLYLCYSDCQSPDYCENIKVLKGCFPDFTPDKAWKLEEMIYKKDKRISIHPHPLNENITRFTRFYDPDGNTKGRDCWYTGEGITMYEALASLIVKIDWTEQEKEQIKAILEK